MTAPVPGPPSGAPLVPDVALALRSLEGLHDRPLHEQVERFDELHRTLQDALATLDEV